MFLDYTILTWYRIFWTRQILPDQFPEVSLIESRVEATTPSVLRLTSLAISRRWGFRFLEKRGHSINAHPVPPKYCGRTPQWFSKSWWKITFGTPHRNNLLISPMTCQCCPLCITADRAQESPAVAFEHVSVPHLKRRRLWDSAKLKSPEIHQLSLHHLRGMLSLLCGLPHCQIKMRPVPVLWGLPPSLGSYATPICSSSLSTSHAPRINVRCNGKSRESPWHLRTLCWNIWSQWHLTSLKLSSIPPQIISISTSITP